MNEASSVDPDAVQSRCPEALTISINPCLQDAQGPQRTLVQDRSPENLTHLQVDIWPSTAASAWSGIHLSCLLADAAIFSGHHLFLRRASNLSYDIILQGHPLLLSCGTDHCHCLQCSTLPTPLAWRYQQPSSL